MADKVFKNLEMNVKIFNKARNFRRSYSLEDLKEKLDRIPFDIVSIPVFVYRNEYSGNLDSHGNILVGYITRYDRESFSFDLTIMEAYGNRVSEYKDPIIYPRVSIGSDGNVKNIIAFDLCQSIYYANLMK